MQNQQWKRCSQLNVELLQAESKDQKYQKDQVVWYLYLNHRCQSRTILMLWRNSWHLECIRFLIHGIPTRHHIASNRHQVYCHNKKPHPVRIYFTLGTHNHQFQTLFLQTRFLLPLHLPHYHHQVENDYRYWTQCHHTRNIHFLLSPILLDQMWWVHLNLQLCRPIRSQAQIK